MRQHTAIQTYPHLFVWQSQGIEFRFRIIILDSNITTLIKQRHDSSHRLSSCIEIILWCIHLFTQVNRCKVIFPHHIKEISRSAWAKPIGINLSLWKASEQAVWIEYVRRRPSEMIAIIIFLQLFQSFIIRQAQHICHLLNIFMHFCHKFLLGNAANASIFCIHTHISNIIEFTEYTKLRELGDAC